MATEGWVRSGLGWDDRVGTSAPAVIPPNQTRAAGQAGQESRPDGRHQPPNATRLEASNDAFSQHAPASPHGVGESNNDKRQA